MAKFVGVIGYAVPVEVSPGVWGSSVIEKPCRGDLIKNVGKYEPSGEVNDDINISNQISILCDPYAMKNIGCMKYLKFTFPHLGSAWKINSATVVYPRIQLDLGGVYNGEQA